MATGANKVGEIWFSSVFCIYCLWWVLSKKIRAARYSAITYRTTSISSHMARDLRADARVSCRTRWHIPSFHW